MAELKIGLPSFARPVPSVADPNNAEVKEMTPMVELESQLKVNRIEIANRERDLELLKGKIAEYQSRLNREPIREQQLADLTRNYVSVPSQL